jgi:hypothetical protein
MHFLLIALPIVALATGIAAYIQYLKSPGQMMVEAYREGGSDEGRAGNETVYQGLLWLKNKYEEDRERSTTRYMELKEEYERLREQYQTLGTSHTYTQDLLNERQSTIDRLRGQLQQESQRTEEAKGKLESSGHLLLQMHKELDIALAGDKPPATRGSQEASVVSLEPLTGSQEPSTGSQELSIGSQELSIGSRETSTGSQEPSLESQESSVGSQEPSVVISQ